MSPEQIHLLCHGLALVLGDTPCQLVGREETPTLHKLGFVLCVFERNGGSVVGIASSIFGDAIVEVIEWAIETWQVNIKPKELTPQEIEQHMLIHPEQAAYFVHTLANTFPDELGFALFIGAPPYTCSGCNSPKDAVLNMLRTDCLPAIKTKLAEMRACVV